MSHAEVRKLAEMVLLSIIGAGGVSGRRRPGSCPTDYWSAEVAWKIAEQFAAEDAKRNPATLPGGRL